MKNQMRKTPPPVVPKNPALSQEHKARWRWFTAHQQKPQAREPERQAAVAPGARPSHVATMIKTMLLMTLVHNLPMALGGHIIASPASAAAPSPICKFYAQSDQKWSSAPGTGTDICFCRLLLGHQQYSSTGNYGSTKSISIKWMYFDNDPTDGFQAINIKMSDNTYRGIYVQNDITSFNVNNKFISGMKMCWQDQPNALPIVTSIEITSAGVTYSSPTSGYSCVSPAHEVTFTNGGLSDRKIVGFYGLDNAAGWLTNLGVEYITQTPAADCVDPTLCTEENLLLFSSTAAASRTLTFTTETQLTLNFELDAGVTSDCPIMLQVIEVRQTQPSTIAPFVFPGSLVLTANVGSKFGDFEVTLDAAPSGVAEYVVEFGVVNTKTGHESTYAGELIVLLGPDPCLTATMPTVSYSINHVETYEPGQTFYIWASRPTILDAGGSTLAGCANWYFRNAPYNSADFIPYTEGPTSFDLDYFQDTFVDNYLSPLGTTQTLTTPITVCYDEQQSTCYGDIDVIWEYTPSVDCSAQDISLKNPIQWIHATVNGPSQTVFIDLTDSTQATSHDDPCGDYQLLGISELSNSRFGRVPCTDSPTCSVYQLTSTANSQPNWMTSNPQVVTNQSPTTDFATISVDVLNLKTSTTPWLERPKRYMLLAKPDFTPSVLPLDYVSWVMVAQVAMDHCQITHIPSTVTPNQFNLFIDSSIGYTLGTFEVDISLPDQYVNCRLNGPDYITFTVAEATIFPASPLMAASTLTQEVDMTGPLIYSTELTLVDISLTALHAGSYTIDYTWADENISSHGATYPLTRPSADRIGSMQLDIIDPCESASFHPSTILDMTYMLTTPASTQTFVRPQDSVESAGAPVTSCGPRSYSLVDVSTGAAPSYITLDFSLELTLTTADPALVGVHQVMVRVVLDNYPAVVPLEIYFNAEIVPMDPCINIVFTPSTLTDQEYVLSKPAVDYTIPDYAENPPNCDVLYTWTTTDSTDLTSLITFDGKQDADGVAPDDLTFSFYAPDHSLIATLEEIYTITVVATYTTTGLTIASAPSSFNLKVLDPCQFATITFTPTVFVDFTYMLYDAAHPPLTWTDATAAQSDEPESLCGIFQYFMHEGDAARTAIDAAIFTFNPSTNPMTLSTYSTDNSLALLPTYQIFVEVMHIGYVQTIQTISFTVTFADFCATAAIFIPNPPTDQQYQLREPMESYMLPIFSSHANCPITYTYTVDVVTPDIVNNVVNFDGVIDGDPNSPNDLQFTWVSMDVNYAGVYVISVTGDCGVATPNQVTTSFTLTLIHPCEVASLTVDAAFLTVSHPRGPAMNLPFTIANKVTSDIDPVVDCGAIEIDFVQQPSGDPMDTTVFTLDESKPPNLSFDIETIDFLKVGAHPMLFRARYIDFAMVWGNAAFEVTITDPCDPPQWDTPSPVLADQTYTFTEALFDYSVLADFQGVQNPSFCLMTLSYSAVKDGTTTDLFADLITFDGTLNGDANDGVFTIGNLDYANQAAMVGTYVVTVTASAGETTQSVLALAFTLTVIEGPTPPQPDNEEFVVSSNAPPTLTDLSDVQHLWSESTYIEIGMDDVDGDQITVVVNPGLAVNLVFCNQIDDTRIGCSLSPMSADPMSDTSLTVIFELTDSFGNEQSFAKDFVYLSEAAAAAEEEEDVGGVNVGEGGGDGQEQGLEQGQEVYTEDEQQSIEDFFSDEGGESLLLKELRTKYGIPKNDSEDPIKQEKITANITEIDAVGLVTIRFSHRVQIPTNWTNITDEELRVLFTQNSDEIDQTGNFTFNLTVFFPDYIQIQLIWNDPTLISQGDQPDLIEIRLSRYFFLNHEVNYTGDESPLPKPWDRKRFLRSKIAEYPDSSHPTLDYILPKMVSSREMLEQIEALAESVAVIMDSTFWGLLALQLVASSVMKYMWAIFNTLQVITVFPLMELKFPVIIETVFEEFQKVVNLDVIPKEAIYDSLIGAFFADSADSQKQANESKIVEAFKEGQEIPTSQKLVELESSSILSKTILYLVVGLTVGIMIGGFCLCKYVVVPRCSPRGKRWYRYFENKLMYNSIIRTCIQTYLPVAIYTCVALNQMSGSTSEEKVSFVLTLALLGYCIMFPCLAYWFVRKFRWFLPHPKCKAKFGSFYTDVDYFKLTALCMVLMYLLRRGMIAAAITFCSASIVLQLAVTVYSCQMMLIFLVCHQPMKTNLANSIQILNEVFLFLCGASMFVFTDWLNGANRHNFGVFYLSAIGTNVGVNLILALVTIIRDFKEKMRLKKLRMKVQADIKRKQELLSILHALKEKDPNNNSSSLSDMSRSQIKKFKRDQAFAEAIGTKKDGSRVEKSRDKTRAPSDFSKSEASQLSIGEEEEERKIMPNKEVFRIREEKKQRPPKEKFSVHEEAVFKHDDRMKDSFFSCMYAAPEPVATPSSSQSSAAPAPAAEPPRARDSFFSDMYAAPLKTDKQGKASQSKTTKEKQSPVIIDKMKPAYDSFFGVLYPDQDQQRPELAPASFKKNNKDVKNGQQKQAQQPVPHVTKELELCRDSFFSNMYGYKDVQEVQQKEEPNSKQVESMKKKRQKRNQIVTTDSAQIYQESKIIKEVDSGIWEDSIYDDQPDAGFETPRVVHQQRPKKDIWKMSDAEIDAEIWKD